MKFMRRMAKYIWHDYKTYEDISSELKINPVVKKVQNYINKWIHDRRTNRDSLVHFIVNYEPCGKRSQRRPLEDP
jgi:hypothetical protein